MHAKGATDPRATDARTPAVAGLGTESTLGGLKQEKSKEKGEVEELVGWAPGHVPMIEDYRSVMLQRAIFQGLASMGLPAFTIHSIVRYSGRALKDAKNMRIRTYGPIGVCYPLSLISPPPFSTS